MREATEDLRGKPVTAVRAAWPAGRWRRSAGVAVVAALFLAWCGAFGSGVVPFSRRTVFWVLAIAAGSLVGGVGEWFLIRRADRRLTPLSFVGLTLTIAAPTTLVVWGLAGWLLDHGWRLRDLPGFVPPVVVVTAAMVVLNQLSQRAPPMTHAVPDLAQAAPPVRARLLDRLPAQLRGGVLLAVEAEDHYLRLHTTRGSDLILLRLADAIAELDGIEGAQTHRSWWVAREAVIEARRAEGRATLVLQGGVEAPVSRTYARALREAGWF